MQYKLWKLFLDDLRFPADNDPDWVICRNTRQAMEEVEYHGPPYYMTLDHDLGDDEPTGFDFAKSFVEWMMDHPEWKDKWTCKYYVHSQNPVGAENIQKYLDGFVKAWYDRKMDETDTPS